MRGPLFHSEGDIKPSNGFKDGNDKRDSQFQRDSCDLLVGMH